MHKHCLKRRWAWVIIPALLLLMAGCASAPQKQVAAFGQSAQLVAKSAATAYARADQVVLRRKQVEAALDPAKVMRPEQFQGMWDGGDEYALLVDVLTGLGGYGAALGELSQAGDPVQVRAGGKALFASIQGLKTSYEKAAGQPLKLRQQNLALVSTLLSAATSAAMQDVRDRAIKQVVIATAPAVDQAAGFLAVDLPKMGRFLRANLDTAFRDLRRYYRDHGKDMGFMERMSVLENLAQAKAAAGEAEAFCNQAARAAQRMGDAHRALLAAVKKGALASPDLAERVADLYQSARELAKMYLALAPKE